MHVTTVSNKYLIFSLMTLTDTAVYNVTLQQAFLLHIMSCICRWGHGDSAKGMLHFRDADGRKFRRINAIYILMWQNQELRRFQKQRAGSVS